MVACRGRAFRVLIHGALETSTTSPRSLVALLSLLAATASCTPLTPEPVDSGVDAGAVDSGSDGGGDPDAWPCDGGPCAVENIITHHTLPLAVLPVGGFVYWSEFGPNNTGVDGTIRRMPRGATCLVLDGGCGTGLSQSLLANISPESIITDGVDVCWIAYSYDRSNIYCFDIGAGVTRRIAQDEPYPVALTWLNGELAWARLNFPASAANGAIVAKPRDGGALRPIISGRGLVRDLTTANGAVVWAEQVDGGTALFSLAPDGGAARWASSTGRITSLAAAGGWLYFVDYDRGDVRRLLLGSTVVEPLAAGEHHPLQVLVDGSMVYWLAFGSPPDGPDGALRGVRVDGGVGARTFAAGLPALNQFSLEGGYAWWAAQGTTPGNFEDGAVQRTRLR